MYNVDRPNDENSATWTDLDHSELHAVQGGFGGGF